jgi:hypothetical protein
MKKPFFLLILLALKSNAIENNIEPKIIKEYKNQAPLLIRYGLQNFCKGLAYGLINNFITNLFDFNNETYCKITASLYLTQFLHDFVKNHEEIDARFCLRLANHYNYYSPAPYCHIPVIDDEILQAQKLQEGKFQPHQFKIQNEAYRWATVITSFLIGAYIGGKVGTTASNGCCRIWSRFIKPNLL